jgi:putative solute:sodium symporter small subunit
MGVNDHRAFWRRNILYVSVLMVLWFAASFGAAILFADSLDSVRLGGFKLGFWFGQQGAIFVFVGIVFLYVWLMRRLDRKYGVEDTEDDHPEERKG